MKILLAEDDKNLGRLLQNLLKKENIKTDWVEDGDRNGGFVSFITDE